MINKILLTNDGELSLKTFKDETEKNKIIKEIHENPNQTRYVIFDFLEIFIILKQNCKEYSLDDIIFVDENSFMIKEVMIKNKNTNSIIHLEKDGIIHSDSEKSIEDVFKAINFYYEN